MNTEKWFYIPENEYAYRKEWNNEPMKGGFMQELILEAVGGVIFMVMLVVVLFFGFLF